MRSIDEQANSPAAGNAGIATRLTIGPHYTGCLIRVVMRNRALVHWFVPLVLVVALSGCAHHTGVASMSRVAALRSNEEASRLYRVEPFTAECGHWRTEGERHIWDALASSGRHDLIAKVIFDRRGSVVSTGVQMIAHPDTAPNTDRETGLPRSPVSSP